MDIWYLFNIALKIQTTFVRARSVGVLFLYTVKLEDMGKHFRKKTQKVPPTQNSIGVHGFHFYF